MLAKNCNSPNIIHYLDDFLFAGSRDTSHCTQLAESFQTLCQQFGIPINSSKTEDPTSKLTFLGLGIDTVTQTIFIPTHKCSELQTALRSLLQSIMVTLNKCNHSAAHLLFLLRHFLVAGHFVVAFIMLLLA